MSLIQKIIILVAVILLLVLFTAFVFRVIAGIFIGRFRPPSAASWVDGTAMETADFTRGELAGMGIVWAVSAAASTDGSGGYGPDYSPMKAVGFPEVFPDWKDDPRAWSPAMKNFRRGPGRDEWLILNFPETLSSKLIVIETFSSGSLARVDDVSDMEQPAVLWEGQTVISDSAGVLCFSFTDRRMITAVRLVFDTRRIPGRPQIDAAGLVP